DGDWRSDVCSSDLGAVRRRRHGNRAPRDVIEPGAYQSGCRTPHAFIARPNSARRRLQSLCRRGGPAVQADGHRSDARRSSIPTASETDRSISTASLDWAGFLMAHEPAAKGRRRAARVAGWIGIVLFGLPVLLLVLISTPPVTRLVVRKLLPKVNEQLNGRLTVEGIGGSLLTRLDLRGVTLRDPEGEVVLQAERLRVGYSLWDLLHSKISLEPLQLERPIVRLLKGHPGEQYSIVRVFQKKTDTKQQPA